MAYIGRQLVRGQNRVLDDISGSFNGSTTAFNLTVSSSSSPPASVNQLWIILGGVLQKPGTDFTVADAVITFTTAPASTLSFWGMIQGDTSDINSPADASVTPSKIANSGDFAFPADVRFKDADGSHYVGLQAPSTVSSNLVWTLPAADGSANQVLKTDGSGALGWASDANAPEGTAVLSTGETGTTKYLRVDGDNTCSWQLAVDATKMPLAGGTFTGDITIPDKIIHDGDTNTAVRFPAADTVSVETGGSERLRVDSSGSLLLGTTSSRDVGFTHKLQLEGTSTAPHSFSIIANRANTHAASIDLAKSRGSTIGSNTVVQDDDNLGHINFRGADGTDLTSTAARITSSVDGTPGGDDMPGRLEFLTTADGASAPTERMRIDSSGNVGIGITPVNTLSVAESSTEAYVNATDSIFRLTNTNTSADTNQTSITFTTATTGVGSDSAIVSQSISPGNTDLEFYTDNSNGLTEKLRIQSGGGISFNGDSAAANALDDYEEGLYTATLTCLTSGTITIDSSWDQLAYTKIGRVVYVTGRIRTSAVSSPSGAQLRLNLPVVSAGSTEDSGRVTGYVYVQGGTKNIQDYTSMPTMGGNTYIQIGFADTSNSSGDVCGAIDASTLIAVNFHYIT